MNSEQIVVALQKDVAVALMPFLITGSFLLTVIMLLRRSIRQDLRFQSPKRWVACIITLTLAGAAIFFGGFYFLGYFADQLNRESLSGVYIPLLYAIQGIVQQLLLKLFFRPQITGALQPQASATNPGKSAAIILGGSLPVVIGLLFRYTDAEDTSMIYVVMPFFIALPFVAIWYFSTRKTK